LFEELHYITRKNIMKNIGRRKFITAGISGMASIMYVPRFVLGGNGYISPNDKLNIAGIGIGGMGSNDIKQVESENIIALCDVDDRYAERTIHRYPNAKNYKDYREMLATNKDIDAVMIATPDHTHAVIAMAAMKQGKNVFCQKPLAHNIYETRELVKTSKNLSTITQMGIQGHVMDGNRLICDWIWDGAIGEVTKVEAWCSLTHYPPGHRWWSTPCESRPHVTPPTPNHLDWDLWLGPAEHRPYSPCYHPGVWRNWWDFGSGMMADRGCHTFDPIMSALKLKYPVSIEAISTNYNEETYPVASIVNYRFPKREGFPELELTWYEGLRPPRPKELEGNRLLGASEGGALFIGTKGKLMCGVYGESPRLIPESKMRAYKQPKKNTSRSPNIYQEWLNSCRGKSKTSANFNYSGLLTEIVLLGNLAKRFNGQLLRFDEKEGKILNNPEANNYFHQPYRDGWSL
jgi:predicted dehydrogenase